MILLIIGCLLVVALLWRPSLSSDISADTIQPGTGHSFRVPLLLNVWPGYEIATDSVALPKGSQLRLMQDGTEFGTPHSLHSRIRSQGAGAYSHWESTLRFSTPDNQDPRFDGHQYSYRVPMKMVVGLFNGLLLVAAVCFILAAWWLNTVMSAILAVGLAMTVVPIVIQHYTLGGTVFDRPVAHIESDRAGQRADESVEEWVTRLSDMIHERTENCAPSEFELSHLQQWLHRNLSMPTPFHQGILFEDRFRCGFCHQRAYLLSRLLRLEGLDSYVLGLSGHVVALFRSGGIWYSADPDYGVRVFRYSPESGLGERVREAYAGFPNSDGIASMFTSLEDNQPYWTNEVLDGIRSRQRTFFTYSDHVAAALGLFSLVVLGSLGFRTYRARRAARTT